MDVGVTSPVVFSTFTGDFSLFLSPMSRWAPDLAVVSTVPGFSGRRHFGKYGSFGGGDVFPSEARISLTDPRISFLSYYLLEN